MLKNLQVLEQQFDESNNGSSINKNRGIQTISEEEPSPDQFKFEERSYVDNISSSNEDESQQIEIDMRDSDDSDFNEGFPNTVYSVDLTQNN